jgi:hypothetical protein
LIFCLWKRELREWSIEGERRRERERERERGLTKMKRKKI